MPETEQAPEIEVNALRFLDSVVPVLDAAERTDGIFRRKLGSAFRIADYTVGGYEVPVNRILGDLLDPRGRDGQRHTFLELFLEMVNDIPRTIWISGGSCRAIELARDDTLTWQYSALTSTWPSI